jgi:uncharacterized lipoprotein YbaY
MRRSLLAVAALLLLATPASAQDADGISTEGLSRCAGKVGAATRESDPAFGILFLNGMPWLDVDTVDDQIGTVRVATSLSGSGVLRRKDGTLRPFRFTCLLDDKGQAVMFQASRLLPGVGDELAPARMISGMATLPEKLPQTRGIELRVQLLDTAAGEILAEQVVRSGWIAPIPFALRVPMTTKLDGRKLAIAARVVLSDQVLFRLAQPRALGADELRGPIDLGLVKVETAKP